MGVAQAVNSVAAAIAESVVVVFIVDVFHPCLARPDYEPVDDRPLHAPLDEFLYALAAHEIECVAEPGTESKARRRSQG